MDGRLMIRGREDGFDAIILAPRQHSIKTTSEIYSMRFAPTNFCKITSQAHAPASAHFAHFCYGDSTHFMEINILSKYKWCKRFLCSGAPIEIYEDFNDS